MSRRGAVAGRTDVGVRRSDVGVRRSDVGVRRSDADVQRSDADVQLADADARGSGVPELSIRPEPADPSIAQRPSILDD
ncbi:hypothetical protein [Halobellus rarus]|uniref:Uncharacterized protein n=1 Tax=Halobellus rarus TaxID=1126237 RepID=A0ABD6CMX6_9EURY|nr:hypothetical protein [Halobellus rarus]